jgi:hypothetical protein
VGILLSVARPERIVACLILEAQRLIVDVTVAEIGGLWGAARLDGTRYELLRTLCEKVEVMNGPAEGLRLVQSVR